MEISKIQTFYRGSELFITGGTGFLGKVLIEKLLRSTEVGKIYLLVREKKDKNIKSRVDEMFDDVIFQQIKITLPDYRKKIVGIAGDCSIAGLGLSEADRQLLIKQVNVVFHIAATVRFNEKLRLAYRLNVESTKDCLELCKQIEHLKVFIHVSTAYANCIFETIEEKFYDYPANHDEIGELIKKLSDEEIKEQQTKIIGEWPNTYSFTKALAESFIRENSTVVPIGIFRPGIVLSTYQEPLEGWVDNRNGPIKASVDIVSGYMRFLHCDKSKHCDVIPVDYCIAGLLASAWDVFENRKNTDVLIYNYVSSPENPITWGEYFALTCINGTNYPFLDQSWAVTFKTDKNKATVELLKVIYHNIPAKLFDMMNLLMFKKAFYVNMYKGLHRYQDSLAYFYLRGWKFSNKNVVKMWGEMNEIDRKLFPFSMKNVSWLIFFERFIKGLRLYLLKDKLETVEEAKKKQKRYQVAHDTFKIALYWALGILIYSVLVYFNVY